jgi:hypothetical protein
MRDPKLKALLKALSGKRIVLISTFKGGKGKTATGLGLSFALKAAYLINDKGSVTYAATSKYYDHTYKYDRFEEDEFFKKCNTVVIDLGGFIDNSNIDTIKELLNMAKIILLPVGWQELDLKGGVLTMINLKEHKEKITFLFSAEPIGRIEKKTPVIQQELKKYFESASDINILPIRYSEIVNNAIISRKGYEAYFNNLTKFRQTSYRGYMEDWEKVVTVVKKRLGLIS